MQHLHWDIPRIEGYLAEREAEGFSGMVLIAAGEQPLLTHGYGLANREQRLVPTSETVYCIGSLTKQFTAAAILHLEMDGRLSVKDSIADYFDNMPTDKAEITLHHLLSHTAGLEDIFGDDYDVVSRDWLVEQVMQSRLLWQPGHRYQYSNAGYSLLGAIIEIVSGQPYEGYLHSHLFEPGGLQKTGYRIPNWQAAEMAVGYENDVEWGTPLDHVWAEDGPGWNLRANGGILSTTHDMYQWLLALKNDRILSAGAKARLFGRHAAIRPSHFYAYGWGIAEMPHGTYRVGHFGGNGVFNAVYRWWPEDDHLMLIILSNVDRCAGETYSPTLEKMLFNND